jgi:hypothetical protein
LKEAAHNPLHEGYGKEYGYDGDGGGDTAIITSLVPFSEASSEGRPSSIFLKMFLRGRQWRRR